MGKQPSLEELKRIWDRKLKKSGFEDIETKNGTLANTTHSGGNLDKRRVTWQSQEEYYRLARHFVHDYAFEKPIHKVIWEYHAEGISTRNIAKLLNKVRRKKIDRQTVWELVNKFAAEMKKMYGIEK